jgi:hypothetical protein
MIMDKEAFIPTREICSRYEVEIAFLEELSARDLLEVQTVEETPCVATERLGDLERYIRLHYELDINLEGIEVVCRLLDQLTEARRQIQLLETRLRAFQD